MRGQSVALERSLVKQVYGAKPVLRRELPSDIFNEANITLQNRRLHCEQSFCSRFVLQATRSGSSWTGKIIAQAGESRCVSQISIHYNTQDGCGPTTSGATSDQD